jgi:hypothetical protein
MAYASLVLDQAAQALQCASGLALWDSTNERAAHDCPNRPKRHVELVAIVKARASVRLGCELVLGAGARVRRAAPLPDSVLVGDALGKAPVNVERDSSQRELLVHPVPNMDRPFVAVAKSAVDADPISEPKWVHHGVPHLLRGCGDDD